MGFIRETEEDIQRMLDEGPSDGSTLHEWVTARGLDQADLDEYITATLNGIPLFMAQGAPFHAALDAAVMRAFHCGFECAIKKEREGMIQDGP